MPTPNFILAEQLIEFREEDVRPDGTLVLDVVRDVYRPAQYWLYQNMSVVSFVSAEGGQVLAGGIRMPVTIIIEGWKIRPPNNCTNIELRGNLISSDGLSPFSPTQLGHEVSIYEATKRQKGGLSLWNQISLFLLIIVEVVVVVWICKDPNELEPYTAFGLVLVTFIQIASQSRRKLE